MSEEERAASVLERQLLILRANRVQFLDLPGDWMFSGMNDDVVVYVDNFCVRYPSIQHVKSLFKCHKQVIPVLVGTVNVQQPLWAYILWRRDGTFCITLYDFVVGVLNAPSTVFFLEALAHKIVYLDAYDWKSMASMIMMEYAYRLNMSELTSAQCEPKLVGSIDNTHVHSVCKPRRVDVNQIQFMELEDSLQTITVKETRPADLQNYYVQSTEPVNMDDDFFPSALFTPSDQQQHSLMGSTEMQLISGLSTPLLSSFNLALLSPAVLPPLSFDLAPTSPGLALAAPTSPGLALAAPTSPGLALAAPTSPGLALAAPTSPGLALAAPTSPGLALAAPTSPGLALAAPTSPGLPPLPSGLPPLPSGLPPLPSGLPPLPSGLPPQSFGLVQPSVFVQAEYPLIVDVYGREVVHMGSDDPVTMRLLSTESNDDLEAALNEPSLKIRPIRRLDRRIERPAYYRLRKDASYFKTVQVVG